MQGSLCDQSSEATFGSRQPGFVLLNTFMCPSVSLSQEKRSRCWKSQLQWKACACSGVTQQTLLLREPATLDCAEELFLQHSPRIVVLAQLTVSRLQHVNEDKWCRQGSNFFSKHHAQAEFPQMAPTSCNNIVSLRSVLNWKGHSCHLPALSQSVSLTLCQPSHSWGQGAYAAKITQAKVQDQKTAHFQNLTLSHKLLFQCGKRDGNIQSYIWQLSSSTIYRLTSTTTHPHHLHLFSCLHHRCRWERKVHLSVPFVSGETNLPL